MKRKYIIPENDADVVDMMKKAGAIILAVTNVSELCMWWESNNNIYGRSRNPYDFNRIVGGSSGGEVAYDLLGVLKLTSNVLLDIEGWDPLRCRIAVRYWLRHWGIHPDAGLLQWYFRPQADYRHCAEHGSAATG